VGVGLPLGFGGGGGVKQGRFSQKVASPLVGPTIEGPKMSTGPAIVGPAIVRPTIVVGLPPTIEQGRFSAKVA